MKNTKLMYNYYITNHEIEVEDEIMECIQE